MTEMTDHRVKKPIVNGSFNHELSNDEMLAFNYETKKQMMWNLIVSYEFAHSFRDIENKVFKEQKSQYHDSYNDTTPENIDEFLTAVRAEFTQRHKELLALSHTYLVEQGKEIKRQQRKLHFGGFLKMDYRQLIGYLRESESWNDFDNDKVAKAVEELHLLTPRRDYGANNPNNGQTFHHWTTCDDYLTLVVPYIGEKDLARWEEFYRIHWKIYGMTIKADSVRMEKNDAGNNYFQLELIFWWD